MTLKLKRFQEEAICRLLEAASVGNERIVLKSCTGSGKTVILTNFADRLMKGRGDVAVVWFTPGTGELEMQSKVKMDRYVHGARTKTIDDVLTSGIEPGDTCFANWEKLNKKSSLALKESERLNLVDRISDAADAGTTFVAIIDESHTNNTAKAQGIVGLFSPSLVIRASATPVYGPDDLLIEVPEDEVIEQGLVKKNIVINQDIPHEAVVESEVEFLLQKANAKRIEVRNAFRKVGEDVNPLVVVQLPDADDRLRAQVEAHLANLGVDCESGRMAIWLSEEHRNTEGIDEPDAKQEFIIIKQAVAVGWDCPRAHVLVKLRDNMTEVFQTQTIGRIRRMPRARHYEVEVLDNCFIYTLDAKFIGETKAAMGGQAWEAKTLQLKKEHMGFTLTSEQRETPHMGFDARQAHAALRSHFVETYSLKSEAGNRPLLAKAGFVFERRLRDTTQSGSVRHADAREIRALERIELEVKASHRDLHDACNNQLSKMARDTGIEYSELAKIFRRLFLKGGQRPKGEEALLSLEQADYYAFVANNAARLKEDVQDALSDDSLDKQPHLIVRKKERRFRFPVEYLMKYDASEKDQSVMSKSVYEGYRCSAQPRSDSEKRFESYCQSSDRVKWFYKNSDKGSEFFSILYLDNAGRDPLFYPDYILEDVEGSIWIIETKGGQKKSGESENIDPYALKKFKALKIYAEAHEGVKAGFVRYDKKSQRLCINTDDYTESLDSLFWRLLSEEL